MCDSAAWLDHGSLLKEGNSHEVVTAYLESVRDDRRAREHAEDGEPVPTEASGWRIDEVHLLDDSGRPIDLLRTGSPLTIRVALEAPTADDVALAIGIYRTDGVHIAGPVHRFSTTGSGRHMVDYHVEKFALAGGVYDVSVALLDQHLQRTHAVLHRAARLDVTPADDSEMGGVVAFDGSWHISSSST
jgi:lipopolysaccharide transport system ATP-binding protein